MEIINRTFFLEIEDYTFYIKRLRRYLRNYKITLICYTLMPNHLHLVARQNSETSISNLIASLHTSYSMYFNKKYDRVGHLFQGRFKQRIINDIDDLVWLSCYVHLNSETDGLAEKAEDYSFSSYSDYIGRRNGTLCDKTIIENYLECSGEEFNSVYKKFVEDRKQEIKERKEIRKLIKDCQ